MDKEAKEAEAAALKAVSSFSTDADSVVDSWLTGEGGDSDGDDETDVERRGARVGLGAKFLPHSKVAFTAEQKLRMKLKHKKKYDEEVEKEEEVVREEEDSRSSMIKTAKKPEQSKPVVEKKTKKRKRAEGASAAPTEDPKIVEYQKKLIIFLVGEGGSCMMTSTKPCVGNDCPIPKGCGELKKFVIKRPALFKIDDSGLLTYIGEPIGEDKTEGQKVEREAGSDENEDEGANVSAAMDVEEEAPAAEKSDDSRNWSEKERRKTQAPPLEAKKAKKAGGRKKTRSRQKNLKKDKRSLSERPTYLTPGSDDYHENYVQARIGYERANRGERQKQQSNNHLMKNALDTAPPGGFELAEGGWAVDDRKSVTKGPTVSND
jgi:hypothetical protein